MLILICLNLTCIFLINSRCKLIFFYNVNNMYYLARVKHVISYMKKTCINMFSTYILIKNTHILNHVTYILKNLLSGHVNDIIIKMFTFFFLRIIWYFYTIKIRVSQRYLDVVFVAAPRTIALYLFY